MVVRLSARKAADAVISDLTSHEQIEVDVQRRLLFVFTTLLSIAAGAYAAAFLWQQSYELATPLVVLLAVLQASRHWGMKHDCAAAGLRVAVIAASLPVGYWTLKQGSDLPASGWWLSIFPLILSVGGLYRLAAVLVSCFLLIVIYLHASGLGLIPHYFGTPLPVPAWRQFTSVVGSEVLALVAITFTVIHRKKSAQALARAREAAAEAAAAKAEFLAKMSHEVRTPLNGILATTDLLKASRLTETEQSQLLLLLEKSTRVLMGLVNDVLDYSKLEAGKITLLRDKLDPEELVASVCEQFSVQAFDKGLDLTWCSEDDVPLSVHGDTHRLRQILGNLVSNAVKFTAQGAVNVHLSADAAVATHDSGPRRVTLKFAVRDSGLGISAQGQERLFQAFSQADDATYRKFGGTGLGLSISQELAHLMGGQVLVKSEPGKGSVFTLELPVEVDESGSPGPLLLREDVCVVAGGEDCERHLRTQFRKLGVEPRFLAKPPADDLFSTARLLLVDLKVMQNGSAARWQSIFEAHRQSVVVLAPLGSDAMIGLPSESRVVFKPVRAANLKLLLAPSATPATPQDSPTDPLPALHVLVADDNPINQIVTVSLLRKLGATAVVVGDGAKALEQAKAQAFDLVLMDMQMPEMDGLTATQALRQHEATGARQRTVVLAMTANSESDVVDMCLAAGMDGVLSKPFGLDELRSQLLKVTHPQAAATESSIRRGR